MSVTCSANSPLSVSHKGSMGTSIAFPDVCKTPTPVGPIPIPYPNVAQAKDLSDGSSSVKMDGQPVMLKSSNFMMSTGDEAGSAMGVVSNKIKGKLQFVNYSFDIKVEGQNVCRLSDPAQQNMGTANAMSPFHMQGPIPPGEGMHEACRKTRERVREQKQAGKQAQWGNSGVIERHQSAFQSVVDEYGCTIYIRQSNPLCREWIEQNHLPKPHACLIAKTAQPSNIALLRRWLERTRVSPGSSITRADMLRSNQAYSRNPEDYFGVTLSLVPGPQDNGRPLRGKDPITASVVKDAGLDYSRKWVTGDYDLMDIMSDDAGCHRLKEGFIFHQIKRDLNVTMNWDGIQHGPQAQWIPRKSRGDNVNDSFPMRIGNWLKRGARNRDTMKWNPPPKVPIGGGRKLKCYYDCLTVVAPGTVVHLKNYDRVKDALLCCGCRNPGEKID